MSLFRDDANEQHFLVHAIMRALAAIAVFTIAGVALGALWGALDDQMLDHIAQGLMIGAGFGGIAGVFAAFMGVPNRDKSAEV